MYLQQSLNQVDCKSEHVVLLFSVFLRYLTDNQRVFSSYVSGKEFSGGSAAQCEVLCGWMVY